MGQEETDPASLFADGTGANSILNLVPGGIFDADRNIITTSLAALEEALTGLNGSSLTQLQAASTSQVRQLIGGLTQLTAGINQLATGIAVPLDPTQTLQGFANQSIAQAETAASTALRNIGSIG
jgi:X-X-X-Leu-X-X-Gly heptad repeat protein